MVQEKSSKPSGSGLELDRMEIPKRGSSGVSPRPMRKPDQTPSPSVEKPKDRKRQLWIILAAVVTTLVFLIILANVLKREELSINLTSGEKAAYVSKNLLRVGPVTATLPNNDIIRLSVNIDCMKGSLKEDLAEKEPLIRDKIVAVLTDPETERLLESQQYDAVRNKIRLKLAAIAGNEIGEVYFSEILTY